MKSSWRSDPGTSHLPARYILTRFCIAISGGMHFDESCEDAGAWLHFRMHLFVYFSCTAVSQLSTIFDMIIILDCIDNI